MFIPSLCFRSFLSSKERTYFLFALSQKIDTLPAFQNTGQHKKCEFEGKKRKTLLTFEKTAQTNFFGNTDQLLFAEALLYVTHTHILLSQRVVAK